MTEDEKIYLDELRKRIASKKKAQREGTLIIKKDEDTGVPDKA